MKGAPRPGKRKMNPTHSNRLESWTAFEQGKAVVRLQDWTAVRFAGDDCRTFLHSFCTAHTKQFENGDSAEAHILNDKGKVLSYGWMQYLEKEILYISTPGQFDTIFEHLDKYNFQEVVEITDASHDFEISFAHASSGLDDSPWTNNGTWTRHASGSWTRPGTLFGSGIWILQMAAEADPSDRTYIDSDSVDWLRIESGIPLFGTDMNVSNLPQEILRDDQSIHFEKGCYLGQETVARIDALGQVNKLLTTVKLSGEVAEPFVTSLPHPLLCDAKEVGQLTSLSWSPRDEAWFGMGIIRRANRDHELAFADVDVKAQRWEGV